MRQPGSSGIGTARRGLNAQPRRPPRRALRRLWPSQPANATFTRWGIPVLATAALLLAACRGNGGTEVQDINGIAESVGCESPTPAPTEELYVQDAVECADGSRS